MNNSLQGGVVTEGIRRGGGTEMAGRGKFRATVSRPDVGKRE